MPNYRCQVVTPTHELFSGEIAYAEIPGAMGSFGILSGHEMIVSTNRPGVVTLWLDADGKEKRKFALYEGASQMIDDKLIIMGGMGVDVADIDAEAVRAEADASRESIEALEKAGGEAVASRIATERERIAWCDTRLKAVETA